MNPRSRMETFYPTEGRRDVTVLIIEDEELSRKALGMLLADSGYTAEVCGSAEEALSAMNSGDNSAIALVDFDLPGMNGADFVEYLSQAAPEVQSVLVTAEEEERVNHLTAGGQVR